MVKIVEAPLRCRAAEARRGGFLPGSGVERRESGAQRVTGGS